MTLEVKKIITRHVTIVADICLAILDDRMVRYIRNAVIAYCLTNYCIELNQYPAFLHKKGEYRDFIKYQYNDEFDDFVTDLVFRRIDFHQSSKIYNLTDIYFKSVLEVFLSIDWADELYDWQETYPYR